MKKLRKSYHWNQVINNVQIFTDTVKPIFHTFLARLLFDSNKQHANASFLFRTLLGTEKCLAIKSLILQHKFCNLLKFSFFSIFKKLTIGNF